MREEYKAFPWDGPQLLYVVGIGLEAEESTRRVRWTVKEVSRVTYLLGSIGGFVGRQMGG